MADETAPPFRYAICTHLPVAEARSAFVAAVHCNRTHLQPIVYFRLTFWLGTVHARSQKA